MADLNEIPKKRAFNNQFALDSVAWNNVVVQVKGREAFRMMLRAAASPNYVRNLVLLTCLVF